MQTTKRTGGRSGWITMVLAGLGLWLATAGAALAADQWFDSATAAGIQPSSGSTGGLVWANSPAGSTMWASTSAGTTTPNLWTNGNNAYFTAAGTATVGVNGATASSVIFDSAGTWVFTNAGAPFTFADLTLKGGTVTVYSNALGSSSSTPVTLGGANQLVLSTLKLGTVAAGDNTFNIGNLTSAGPAVVLLTNTVAGSTPILSAQTLARSGRGILVVAPTNISTLGVTSKALFTGGNTLTAGGILAPWLVGLPMTGSASLYDFVTYGADGLTTNGLYQSGAWDSTKVTSAGGTTLAADASLHALKLTSAITVNNGVTFTLGDGTCAGLLLDNTGGGGNLLGAGTLSVGTAELIVHSPGSSAFIYPTISGSGGLTLNALRGDGTGGSVTISNMTYTGDTWIQNGTLGVAPGAGITHTYTNSIRGLGNLTKSGAGTLNLTGNSSILGTLTVNNGTLAFNGGTWTNLGNGAFAGGTTVISNGASVSCLSASAGPAVSGGGVLTITNATLTSVGVSYVGNGANNNTVNVLGGGLWNESGATLDIGRSGGNSNQVAINGGTLTNAGAVGIGGNAAGMTGNSLVLGSGGKMYSGLVTVGNASGTNNTATVQNGGVLSSVGLTLNGTDNTAAVHDGGVWNLGNGALTFNASVPAPQSAVQTSGSGVFTNVGGITLSGGNQTFAASVASNFTLGTAGAIILGSAGNGGNMLTITGQTFTTSSSSSIGNFAGSNSNTLNVLAGTVWRGGGQTLIIGNAGSTGNVVRVDGGGVSGGAIVTNFSATSLLKGVGNSFIVTNGAQAWVTANPAMVGIGNTWKVVGGGVPGVTTLVDLAGTAGSIGNDATSVGNTLVVDGNGVYGGAVVTNGSQLRFGTTAGAMSSGLSIANGGWVFAPATFAIGYVSGANANFLNVGSAGMTSYLRGSPTIGNAAGSFYNTMTTTNAVLLGGLDIGSAGSSNTVTVFKDTAWDFAGQGLTFSQSATSTGNVMMINGGVVSNVANVSFGNGGASVGSSLTVSKGGQLLVNVAVKLANNTSSSNNVVTVASGGLLEANTLSVGATGVGNVITNFGGIYQFTIATPAITTNGAAGGSIFLNSGVMSFRNVNGANVKGNWAGTQLTKMTFSGTNNAFRLNNSTNLANVATNQTYWFDAITGASTNYAGLEMVSGGTAYTNGSVTIGTNGWLTFSNTTAIMWGAVTNYGQMRIHDSSVTFMNDLRVADGAKFAITGASNLPLVVNGTLTLPASAVVTLTPGAVGPRDTVTLFQSANPISYAGGGVGGWTVTGTHRLSVGSNSLTLRPRMPGFTFTVE